MQFIHIFSLLFIFYTTKAAGQVLPLDFEMNYMPWLEDVDSPQVDNFVVPRTQRATDFLMALPVFESLKNELLEDFIARNEEAGLHVSVIGDYAYNQFQGENRRFPIIRRVRKERYLEARKSSSVDTLFWENVIDLEEFVNTQSFP